MNTRSSYLVAIVWGVMTVTGALAYKLGRQDGEKQERNRIAVEQEKEKEAFREKIKQQIKRLDEFDFNKGK